MFAACASHAGKAVSNNLAPCDMKVYRLDMSEYDAAKIEATLQKFDKWLFTDCEGGDQVEHTLRIDCVKPESRDIMQLLDDIDPPLFRGQREIGNATPRSPTVSYVAVGKVMDHETVADAAHPRRVAQFRQDRRYDDEEVSLGHQDHHLFTYDSQGQIEVRPTPRPLCREIPDELDENGERQGEIMNTRLMAMKTKMQNRTKGMQKEWELETRKMNDWLVKNGFFGITAKRRSLLSSTYPLHVAAGSNEAAMIKLLLRRYADPSQKDSKGRTPLQVAAKKCKKGSHKETISLLTLAD